MPTLLIDFYQKLLLVINQQITFLEEMVLQLHFYFAEEELFKYDTYAK